MDPGPVLDARAPLVVVLGMHRSGTSALTEAISSLGFALSPADQLGAGAPDNERGHFEDRRVVDLNDWILRQHGGSWRDPWPVRAAVPSPDEAQRVGEVWRSMADGVELLKDPRLCITLPWWRAAWEAERSVVYVVIVRHPAQVAASLARVHDLPAGLGELLWLEYVARSIVASEGSHRILVRHADLIVDPEGTMGRVAHELGRLVGRRGPATTHPSVIDPKHVHFTTDGPASLQVVEVAWQLVGGPAVATEADMGAPNPPSDDLAVLGHDLSRLVESLRNARVEDGRPSGEVDEARAEADRAQDEAAGARAERAAARAEADAARDEADAARDEADAARTERAAAEVTAAGALADAAAARAETTRLLAARSWRWTAPLRAIRSRLPARDASQ